MALLITSLGNVPDIIYEVLAFTNLSFFPLYNNHPNKTEIECSYIENFKDDPVTEIWLYTTNYEHNNKERTPIEKIKTWNATLGKPLNFKYIILPFEDIKTKKEVDFARELAFRLVKMAHVKNKNKKLYISIAAGRKTIVSDLQSAGNFFGCDAFIHILSLSRLDTNPLDSPSIPEEDVKKIVPLFYGRAHPNQLSKDYSLAGYGLTLSNNLTKLTFDHFDVSKGLVTACDALLERAQNVFIHQNNDNKLLFNFPILQQLDESLLSKLKNTFITSESMVQGLPKIDLHCHLGGALDVTDCVDLAYSMYLDHQHEPNYSVTGSIQELKSIKKLPFPNRIALLAFYKGKEEELEEAWYGQYLDEKHFAGLHTKTGNFNEYEQLGDLQGSVLLQTREIIGEAVIRLLQKARADNCIGLEIRCSPQNYTQEGLKYRDVLQIILETVDQKREDLEVGIILIASRHRKMSEMYQTIEAFNDATKDKLLQHLIKTYVKGFDVAGNEKARSPAEMRSAFTPILEQCIPITIHAGEIQPAVRIWEAVYELNADRIGHGLTLIKNKKLLRKFLDRNIGIELCPSSNYQIVGYRDFYLNRQEYKDIYPLKQYLEKGLKVTINTDNRGISRTNLCKEFVKASHMSEGKLSLFEALQLCKNSIDSSFFSYDTKKHLYKRAHEMIYRWLAELQLD